LDNGKGCPIPPRRALQIPNQGRELDGAVQAEMIHGTPTQEVEQLCPDFPSQLFVLFIYFILCYLHIIIAYYCIY
jgi:hypothetical protein